MLARRLRASVRASRIANCAVGGHGWPVLAFGTTAQSPSAHTVLWPLTARVFSTKTAPRLSQSIPKSLGNGFGAAPAVHTSVSVAISNSEQSASLRSTTTVPARADETRELSSNVT